MINQQPTQPTNQHSQAINSQKKTPDSTVTETTYKELTERIIHAVNVMNIGPILGINVNVQLLCFI